MLIYHGGPTSEPQSWDNPPPDPSGAFWRPADPQAGNWPPPDPSSGDMIHNHRLSPGGKFVC